MNAKVALLNILSIILINVRQLTAQCDVCSGANQMACVSTTEYRVCINGVPSGTTNVCPNNYTCVTGTSGICFANVAGVVPTCNGGCNVCDANNIFACTGLNTFALCLGQNVPSSVINTCPANQVCNINIQNICGPSSTNTATCSTTPTVSPTTAPTATPTVPPYAQYFCQAVRINTKFRVPADIDNTCRRYIYCFLNNGTWYGQIYTCPGSTYFNSVSRYCETTKNC